MTYTGKEKRLSLRSQPFSDGRKIRARITFKDKHYWGDVTDLCAGGAGIRLDQAIPNISKKDKIKLNFAVPIIHDLEAINKTEYIKLHFKTGVIIHITQGITGVLFG